MAFATIAAALAFTAVSHAQVTYELVKGFDAPYMDGRNPTTIVQAANGRFYGLTELGGLGFGTVFRLEADNALTVLHRFTGRDDGARPRGLLQAANGNFYGTTSDGGASGGGTVFRIDAAGTFTTIHSFTAATEGANPAAGLIQAADGKFYGTTPQGGASGFGTVFRLSAAGALTVLHAFAGGSAEGAAPLAGVIQATDGGLYGTTQSGGPLGYGSVFRVDAAGNFATLHLLTYAEGRRPQAALLQATDGFLYGLAASGGGASDSGTMFRISTAGAFATIHTFTGLDGRGPITGLIQASDGNFYGTVNAGTIFTDQGTIFRTDATGAITPLYAFPDQSATSGVIEGADGALYGGTQAKNVGLALSASTVFRRDAAGTVSTLHAFTTGSDGAHPSTGGLIQATDGDFYGTTSRGGGPTDGGTAFKLTAAGALTTLQTFTFDPEDPKGSFPDSGLLEGGDGHFYGANGFGGAENAGTIFKIDAAGSLTTLHGSEFFADGPVTGRLIQATDGQFYGTSARGTVFRIDSAGTFTRLRSNINGGGFSGVIQGSDGSFYGTASTGGPANRGTIFKVDPAGTFTLLQTFSANGAGAFPLAGLVEGADGHFYGTTAGLSARGTIFSMDLAGNLTTLYKFPKGAQPSAPLRQGADGGFYGTTTYGGAFGFGTIFRLDPSGTFATVYQFSGHADGAYPTGGVFFASDGKLYGTTDSGGPTAGGTVFRLSVTPASLTLAASEVAGCLTTSGTLALTSAAPPGGLIVGVSSDNAHVLVPATVTVPAGASTKKFSIKTTAVAALENATITATTFGLSSPGQMLTLTPMAIKSLSLSPTSVVGGTPISGSVRLQCAAGPGDVVVALSSTQPSAAFPASPTVTVPFGTTTAPFTVTTLPVAKTVKASIQATANGITKSKNVSVTPAP